MVLAHRSVLASLAVCGVLSWLGCSSSSPVSPAIDAGKDTSTKPGRDAGRDTGPHPETGTADVAHKDTGRPDVGPPPVDSGHDADVSAPGDAGGPSDAGKPPAPIDGGAASATAINFAVHHLWLGDTFPDSTFTADTTGTEWQKFGYNIDGLVTTASSTDVCTLDGAAGATPSIQVDGPNGVDNSFGENIMPTLTSTFGGLSQEVSQSIESGSFTILIDTIGLTSSPTQTSEGLTGQLFEGVPYGGSPARNDAGSFVVTDNWPVNSDLLKGPGLDAGSRVAFPNAHVNSGLWVNGTPGDITLSLNIQGQLLVLVVHQAIITFNHTVDASGQDHATSGIIAGVLRTSEFVAQVKQVLSDQELCSAATLVLNLIKSASDILHDGTNVAAQPCDGISIGLAFDADAIAAPSTVVQTFDAGDKPACGSDGG